MTRSPDVSPSLRAYRPVEFDALIRVGRDFDGGYVLPRSVIEKSQALLSLGVNDDWSFEEGMLSHNPALRVVCVDGTTGLTKILCTAARKSMQLVGRLLTLQMFKFRRDLFYLGRPFAFHRFFSRHEFLPLMVAGNAARGSITLPVLLERITRGDAGSWVIVKCDIEGAEFEVLPLSVGHLRQVAALLIEFHGLDVHWEAFVACMSALMQEFHVAHIHGNNFKGYIAGTRVPITLEMTLVNKALTPDCPGPSGQHFPLPGLDMPNTPKRPDMSLDFG